jgi:flagellar biosynthesis/type III secretory pathway protein FliH
MSSEPPTVRFNRPLSGLKPRAGRLRTAQAEPGPAAQPPPPAEAWRRLETAQQELARREEALALREGDLAAKERTVDDKLHELAGLISSVKEDKAEILEANEQEIVSFSLSITEKVLQYEIENGRYKIGEVVKSTLRAVRDRGALVVRVNPRDHEMTKAAVAQLEQTYGTTRFTVVPDESIPLASCCIETDSGKIFSEIPGRLERIEKSLLKKDGDDDGV